MKLASDIIIRPVITEKSTSDAANGRYTFVVNKNAAKTEIRKACEELFNVRVLKVHTVNYNGKKKRMGVHEGLTPSFKKAIITIDTDPKPEAYQVKGGKTQHVTRKYKNSIEEFGFGQ
ncbi:MAG: 50S ribosomal protein L23 [Clostridia bacterium]|nr:50S ribosomal protein L23 [Clostridia bacterium]